MDALARLAVVARPLLRQVDEALAGLGAPVEHEVWRFLRQVGATPADVVMAFASLSSEGQPGERHESHTSESRALPAAAAALRGQAEAYQAAVVPANASWAGGAGEAYAAQAAALGSHLHGPAGDLASADSLAGRLTATASYVDEVAGWQARSRNRVARALADVLASAQAVTMRTPSGAGVSPRRVLAAADIGAHVLAAAAHALVDGHDLRRAWHERLAELPYHGPVDAGPGRFDATIQVRH